MLESLVFKNFQIHKKKKVDLDRLVTVFTGPSGSGKSALIRGLYWLCFNSPSGLEMLSHDEEEVVVEGVFDGRKLVRKKSTLVNSYSLEGKSFHALGTGGVPEEVEKFLNLSPEINFQLQLEGPYWFLKSPGQVSKELNRVVNLDLVDRSLEYASQEVKRAKGRVGLSEERLGAARDREKALAWATEADRELYSIEVLEERKKSIEQSLFRLEELIFSMQALEGASDFFYPEEDVGEIEILLARKKKLEKDGGDLRDLISRLEREQGRLCQAEHCASEAEAKIKEMTRGRCPLCGSPPPPRIG